ncbi:MAG: hypothetical protein JO057_00880, partial [Chloroflexi bacterium]|nr:hypothetical protein [Chloroflexota bacterium]
MPVLTGRHITFEVPDTLPLFSFDPALLEQAVGNLLANAGAHTPAGMDVPVLETPHILIVDDEPAVRDALRALVGGWGFAVSTAASGPAAIDTAAREQPD